MEPGVQSFSFFRIALHSLMAVALLAMVAAPLSAGTITIQSDATNLGASVASASDPTLASGDISGLTFTPVGTDDEGSFTAVPPGAPSGAMVVQVPPECGWWCGQSGFVEATFTLPATFSAPTLTGAGNVDDWGYVFLNGNPIGFQLDEFDNNAFATSNAAYFQPGVNTLVISDSNTGGPSAVAFYANITYSSAVPEPSTTFLLGSACVGWFGIVRRKFGRNA